MVNGMALILALIAINITLTWIGMAVWKIARKQ